MKQKCIIILSEKSSGSTVVQELISGLADVKYIEYTKHRENETLYWTKAASVLGYPQQKMVASEVPIPSGRARKELISFLSRNLNSYTIDIRDKQSIFQSWEALTLRYGPVFVEKSPHHLLQTSALKLIHECADYLGDVDFYIVGLIRNPMDVIYSQFRRWGTSPDAVDAQWLAAYKNFRLCAELFEERFKVFRYEDLCSDLKSVEELASFLELVQPAEGGNLQLLDRPSISKWRNDSRYGYTLSNSTELYCSEYGYVAKDFENKRGVLWPVYRFIYGTYMSTRIRIRNFLESTGLRR